MFLTFYWYFLHSTDISYILQMFPTFCRYFLDSNDISYILLMFPTFCRRFLHSAGLGAGLYYYLQSSNVNLTVEASPETNVTFTQINNNNPSMKTHVTSMLIFYWFLCAAIAVTLSNAVTVTNVNNDMDTNVASATNSVTNTGNTVTTNNGRRKRAIREKRQFPMWNEGRFTGGNLIVPSKLQAWWSLPHCHCDQIKLRQTALVKPVLQCLQLRVEFPFLQCRPSRDITCIMSHCRCGAISLFSHQGSATAFSLSDKYRWRASSWEWDEIRGNVRAT